MKSPHSPARIERSLRQRLLTAYRRDLPDPPSRILLGFSGGPDSLALAILLANLKRAITSEVRLIHIDHRIRADSAADTRRCQALADALGLPLQVERLADHPVVLHPGVGLEEAARRARYEAFARVAGAGDVVALAHQAGDQAETILLHLMHGTGLSGLAGMQPVSELHVPWWDQSGEEPTRIRLWRPLLDEQRADLLTIIEQPGLTPVHDASNDDLSLKRNTIRHRALPALRAIEPAIDERLGTLAKIAAEEDALLNDLAERASGRAELMCGGLSLRALDGLSIALTRRIVRTWIVSRHNMIPTFDRVEALLDLTRTRDEAARVDVGEGLVAGCFGDALRCGSMEELLHHAWLDARLVLPLAGGNHSLSIEDDTIVVDGASHKGRAGAARRLPVSGCVAVAPVRKSRTGSGQGDEWNDWFRRERVSPWIRDRVQGVAVDSVMWWIPRLGDYDDGGSGRRVRVVWIDQERS